MARVFLSYSHADEALKNKLEAHLAMLKRSGEIEVWHDRLLVVGDHLDGKISGYLETADLIVFLVSSDFLASYYCYEREMTRAMERVADGSARVAPIILRACDWKAAPFAPYVLAPTDAKPVVEHPDIDAALLVVVGELRRALAKISVASPADQPAVSPVEQRPILTEDTVVSPRSSNLRVKAKFTDADVAKFQDEAFEFIAKFFENSLNELQARTAGIDTRFKRISAEKFICEIFRDGRRVSGAKIFIARSYGSREMLCFSNNIDSSDSSMNGGLRIEHDDQILYLKPYMFFSYSSSHDAKLSLHGAAELFWEQVIEPLQR